jgi:hypothetical protein
MTGLVAPEHLTMLQAPQCQHTAADVWQHTVVVSVFVSLQQRQQQQWWQQLMQGLVAPSI